MIRRRIAPIKAALGQRVRWGIGNFSQKPKLKISESPRHMPMRRTPARYMSVRDARDKMHAQEMHAQEMHAHEMHAYEMHAYEMHAHDARTRAGHTEKD